MHMNYFRKAVVGDFETRKWSIQLQMTSEGLGKLAK